MLATENQVGDELLARLDEARMQTDKLFDLVRPDSLYERPIAERHRIIFYIGHLEAFDWNLLHARIGLKPFHPEFDHLFAFGIDPVGGGLPTDKPSDWPALGEARQYNNQVRRTLDAALEAATFAGSDHGAEDPSVLLNVAIEHRLMHAETLAYMLHRLPLDRKVKPPSASLVEGAPVASGMVEVAAGTATLGIPRGHGVFGWDNEFEAHVVEVPIFAIDRYEVTNRDYLRFVAAGGYDDRALWPSERDWEWKTKENITHPAFWIKADGGWRLRTMFEEIPLPLDWPVYVSHAEASAYARWAGKALPTEAEWHRAAYGTPQGGERAYPWGSSLPGAGRGNFDFRSWDPSPVNAFPEGRSAFGAEDLLGNGWEWTSSVFEPFAGFEAFPFYPGYSANFFDGQHYVMKGGSPRTAACVLRRSFRNWFQPRYPYVYAGFRCVST